MIYRVLADGVLVVHLLFIVFAALGAVLVVRYRRMAWIHLPMAAWAALIELFGWYCPLTPLENWLRHRGGEAGYESGFVEHYLLPVIYPGALTRDIQILLGVLVLILNALLYAYGVRSWRRRSRAQRRESP